MSNSCSICQRRLQFRQSAIIDSGKRQTVYVVVGEGIFEPREVMTGWRFNDRVEIVKGLQAGEKIVVSGNFLIDSESRMKLAAVRLMERFDTSCPRSARNIMITEPMTMPQVPKSTNTNGYGQGPDLWHENRSGKS